MVRYTDAQIVAELRRVYKEKGVFSRREYQRHGNISKTTIENRFGTWTAALEKAKLLTRFTKEAKKTVKTAKKAVSKVKPKRRAQRR